jgi:hypothetical protein
LEGNLTPPSFGGYVDVENNGPYFVSGFLDNGPYERFHDVKFSFGAQMYNTEADYDAFFRPLLNDVGVTPTIVMRNRGGSNGTSYQFNVAGFPSEGPLGVCIYRKGGIQLGCGNFFSGAQDEGMDRTTSRQRQLRSGTGDIEYRNAKMDLSAELSASMPEQQDLPYAKANKTVTNTVSGDINIIFASTSVHFHGPCKE